MGALKKKERKMSALKKRQLEKNGRAQQKN